jgi:hypothetical protein
MTTKMNRRPATRDDLAIGARCYKGNGVVEYVITNRFERSGREWFTVCKTTSQGAKIAATGQPQWGGGMCHLGEFTVPA